MLGLGLGLTNNRRGGAVSPYLDGSFDNCVFEIDATQEDSWGGSGNLKNLIAAPADGESQATYDFTPSNVTFTGTVGDAAAYFTAAGSGVFNIASGTNPTFINELHQTNGQNFTIAVAFHKTDNTWTTGTSLFNTTAGLAGSNAGYINLLTTNEIIQSRQHDGSNLSIVISPTVSPADGDHLFVVSIDRDNNEVTFWIDTGTGTTSAQTFGANTADASLALQIFDTMTAEDRFYSAAVFNQVFDNTDVATLAANWGARHGRSYI